MSVMPMEALNNATVSSQLGKLRSHGGGVIEAGLNNRNSQIEYGGAARGATICVAEELPLVKDHACGRHSTHIYCTGRSSMSDDVVSFVETRTASSVLDQLVQSDPSNCVRAIPLGTANVDVFALLILLPEEVPPLGTGAVEGPVGTAIGGTTGGRAMGVPPGVCVAGAEDIVWDVIYRRGAVSDSAQW